MAADLEQNVNAFSGQETAVEKEDERLAEDWIEGCNCRLILCGFNAMGQDLHQSMQNLLHWGS